MATLIRIGLLGNGSQIRKTHLPYLLDRQKDRKDVEIAWLAGCACLESDVIGCPLKWKTGNPIKLAGPETDLLKWTSADWKSLLNGVQAVIISLPNALHAPAIRAALEAGIHVAVDKPATTTARDCEELVNYATERSLLFVTLAQRRFEYVFDEMRKKMTEIGDVKLISYLLWHGHKMGGWRSEPELAGGGTFLDHGFHAIDLVLWLMQNASGSEKGGGTPVSVYAACPDIFKKYGDSPMETYGSLTIRFKNDAVFTLSPSCEGPLGSVDEHLMIYGNGGALRYLRHKQELKDDLTPGGLTWQPKIGGKEEVYPTDKENAKRWAPVADFLDCIGPPRLNPYSPARDSIVVLRVIEKAYQSARERREIPLL